MCIPRVCFLLLSLKDGSLAKMPTYCALSAAKGGTLYCHECSVVSSNHDPCVLAGRGTLLPLGKEMLCVSYGMHG